MSDVVATKATAATTARLDPAASATIAARRARRFYASLAILGGFFLATQGLELWLGAHIQKQPVPLKKPLYSFDATALLPEYGLDARQPPPLPKEVEESLGTHEYMSKVYLDRMQPDGPASRASVFVSYYTGKPDLVPHHPEECQTAAGWYLRRKDEIEVTIDRPGGGQDVIPVSVLVFDPPAAADSVGTTPIPKTVLYFFYANGKYMTTRKAVQIETAFPFGKYSFYSKVELDFYGASGAFASRDDSIEAGRRFIRKLMPALLREHFNWDETLAQDARVGRGEAGAAREK